MLQIKRFFCNFYNKFIKLPKPPKGYRFATPEEMQITKNIESRKHPKNMYSYQKMNDAKTKTKQHRTTLLPSQKRKRQESVWYRYLEWNEVENFCAKFSKKRERKMILEREKLKEPRKTNRSVSFALISCNSSYSDCSGCSVFLPTNSQKNAKTSSTNNKPSVRNFRKSTNKSIFKPSKIQTNCDVQCQPVTEKSDNQKSIAEEDDDIILGIELDQANDNANKENDQQNLEGPKNERAGSAADLRINASEANQTQNWQTQYDLETISQAVNHVNQMMEYDLADLLQQAILEAQDQMDGANQNLDNNCENPGLTGNFESGDMMMTNDISAFGGDITGDATVGGAPNFNEDGIFWDLDNADELDEGSEVDMNHGFEDFDLLEMEGIDMIDDDAEIDAAMDEDDLDENIEADNYVTDNMYNQNGIMNDNLDERAMDLDFNEEFALAEEADDGRGGNGDGVEDRDLLGLVW